MSRLSLLHDGVEETYELNEFRARIRAHIREELDRASAGSRSAIDLTKVAEAEVASNKGDQTKVIQLLGAWPAPLAIFLRTPEGQMLTPDARSLIAKGLGLLGTACVKLGEQQQGEEVMRLAVQYAQDGAAASDIFRRLGEAMLEDGRAGEAVGPARRAANLGGLAQAHLAAARERVRAPPALRRRPRLRPRGPPGRRPRLRHGRRDPRDRAEPGHRAHGVAGPGDRRESLELTEIGADACTATLVLAERPTRERAPGIRGRICDSRSGLPA